MEQISDETRLKQLKLEIEREARQSGNIQNQKINKLKSPKKETSEKNGVKYKIKILIKTISMWFKILTTSCVLLAVCLIAWARANPVYSQIRCKNTEQRIEIVTKYIVENIEYNYISGIENNVGKDVIDRGGGVCDGYTRAFQRLAILNGIKSDVICGLAGNRGGSDYHAWNKVKLNGKWYWHDVTWIDKDQGDAMNMKYYMSEKLWPDHIEDKKLTEQYKKRIKEIDKILEF